MGECLAQISQQGIQRSDIAGDARPSILTGGLVNDSIHIPLQIGNSILTQQIGYALEQILLYLGSSDIEHQLMTCQSGVLDARSQHPIGVSPIQIAVGINHFWLYPEAKLHTQGLDLIDKRFKTVRILDRIGGPITQTREVTIAPFKPAIVKNESLNTDCGCAFC